MITKKRFTLIELLIVIVIIGVLTAIIVPNISDFKKDSTTTAMQANIKNIETALTMYSLENNGKMPVSKKPELGLPEVLMIEQLHPNYLRSQPKVKGMHYWLDYSNKVWASSADSPIGVTYTSDGKLKWNKAENALSYNIFKTENAKVTSTASTTKIIFIDNVEESEIDLPKLKEGELYLVNSVDTFGLESPPVNSSYKGLEKIEEFEGNENIPSNGDSPVEDFKWPYEMKEVTWKQNLPVLYDNDESTYHNLGKSEFLFEWEEDMANRVFKITYETGRYPSAASRDFEFLDAQGNPLPFIDAKTDKSYTTYATNHDLSKRTIEFVVPRGAVSFKVYSGSFDVTIYEAKFVDDLSLPHPVEEVTSEVTSDAVTLHWNAPKIANNFLKVAIYEGDTFLGYSDNGVFTVSSLYSNKEYTFSIEPISVVGNRGPRVHHTNTTKRAEIIWSGLNDALAFDSSLSTYSKATSGSIIQWEGDLANRQITFMAQSSSASNNRHATFSFFDDNGNVIDSKSANDNNLKSSFMWITNSVSTFTYSVIVPEGATHIKFIDSNTTYFLFNIGYGDSLDLPSKLHNVTSTSDNHSITLKFNRPTDVSRVAVFRDGEFVEYTSSDNYTDTTRQSNMSYAYSFETYNKFGHRTENAGTFIGKTTSALINWSGLSDGAAFDFNAETYSKITSGSVIRWDGNLANRQITFRLQSSTASSNRQATFSFFDDEGNVIDSKSANDNNLKSSFMWKTSSTSLFTYSVIVPKGATHMKFISSDTTYFLFNLEYGGFLDLPSKLNNVTSTSDNYSITLKFNRPTDVSRVAVFRDGEFVDYTSSDNYTDTIRQSNTSYLYSFETYNEFGHRTDNAGTFVAATTSALINWSGLSDGAAFDSNMTTYSQIPKGSVIRWDKDLTNRQISFTGQSSTISSSRYATFSFFDDSGKLIPSKLPQDNTLKDSFRWSTSSTSIFTFSVIIPEGATHLKFTETNTTYRLLDFRTID